MAEVGKDIQKAKHILETGGLVAIPTETVYGLAGNAFDEATIAKIFEIKNRPHFDPLIVHVSDIQSAQTIVTEIPESAKKLISHFWPGPLTVLLKKKANIPYLVTAGLSTVAVRSPNHSLTQELLKIISFPLAAPSANPFGYISPTTASHVNDQLGDRIDYILDGGHCNVGIESTILGFENTLTIHRMGGLTIEAIESLVGQVFIPSNNTTLPQTPGQLKSHYAPTKKLVLGNIPELILSMKDKKVGILSLQTDYSHLSNGIQYILSTTGNLTEAAQHLFSVLRKLDEQDIDLIIAEMVPEEGIGRAINDRLKRASVPRN